MMNDIILTKSQRVTSWACRIAAAAILLQTLFFKFTGAEESVYIFSQVGIEPWGRYGSGMTELVAAVLLLTPRFVWAGALLALGVMTGAIMSHLTVLGIVVKNDNGLLFALAIIVFACSAIVARIHHRQIPRVLHFRSGAACACEHSREAGQ